MLKIYIDFSPAMKDEYTTNGIRILTDITSATLSDLYTALQVCVAFRRSSSILDKMSIDINQNNVNVIPTDEKFTPLQAKEEDLNYVPLERIPQIHQFFLDLRKDIHVGIQDHLDLDENKPKIKRKKRKKTVNKKGWVNKRWKKRK